MSSVAAWSDTARFTPSPLRRSRTISGTRPTVARVIRRGGNARARGCAKMGSAVLARLQVPTNPNRPGKTHGAGQRTPHLGGEARRQPILIRNHDRLVRA